jgi:hypothetical protein
MSETHYTETAPRETPTGETQGPATDITTTADGPMSEVPTSNGSTSEISAFTDGPASESPTFEGPTTADGPVSEGQLSNEPTNDFSAATDGPISEGSATNVMASAGRLGEQPSEGRPDQEGPETVTGSPEAGGPGPSSDRPPGNADGAQPPPPQDATSVIDALAANDTSEASRTVQRAINSETQSQDILAKSGIAGPEGGQVQRDGLVETFSPESVLSAVRTDTVDHMQADMAVNQRNVDTAEAAAAQTTAANVAAQETRIASEKAADENRLANQKFLEERAAEGQRLADERFTQEKRAEDQRFADKRLLEEKLLSERPEGLPESWDNKPTRNGDGMQYINPDNEHDRVRIMPGNPDSPNPAQQEPYVKRQIDGIFYDKDGNVVPGDSAEAHIPLTHFKF